MPGNVSYANPTTVLPWSLCRAFSHSRQYIALDNEYRNGESQRGRLVDDSRRSWQISRRITPTILADFRDFYDACNGPHEAFYFYDPWDASPKFGYDPTGVSPVGRYTVRFAAPWSQTIFPGRAEIEIALIEII
ncbi:MAG: hypothetical protein JW730_18220 [Anaerolineales bacterium]|nr:hypothetical protein [Anaerolineales bacterium]